MTRLYHQFLNFLAEKREEYIRPEDQEAREKAEEQHKKTFDGIRRRMVNSNKPHDFDRGSDNSRNMKHDIIYHNDGKIHVRTDLNTGKTSVTHEKGYLPDTRGSRPKKN